MPKKSVTLKQVDSLDFRNNRQYLILSYILRFIGVIIFGLIFFYYTKINNNNELNLELVLNIKIQSFPAIVSIFLIILNVVCILFLHELIHATFVFITHKQKPQIGIRGFIIFAAAPDKKLTKLQFIVNAMAPFTIISTIGLVLIYFLPQHTLSWVFIPTVANAAASGGDFMAVVWAIRQPKNTKFIDVGDITNAYIEDYDINNCC